jgi:hypothetical protein
MFDEIKEKPEECQQVKCKTKARTLLFSGKWKDGLPCLSPDFILDFHKFKNFKFQNVFETKKNIKFFDKGFYYGEMSDDKKFNGKGSCFYSNNFFYRGCFKKGVWHGKGEVFCGLQRIYKGELADGVFHGLGNLYKENGFILMGNFEQGKLQGKGKILMNNGCLFEGHFKDSRRHGKGRIIFVDKSQLDGEYEKGQIEGVAFLSKIGLNGNMQYYKRRYKKGKLKSEVMLSKKPVMKKACCLKFTF